MPDDEQDTTVPPETEDTTVEISIKHLVMGFTVLFVGAFVVGTGIVLVKDYSKYRRQRAMLETTERIILTVQPALKGGYTDDD